MKAIVHRCFAPFLFHISSLIQIFANLITINMEDSWNISTEMLCCTPKHNGLYLPCTYDSTFIATVFIMRILVFVVLPEAMANPVLFHIISVCLFSHIVPDHNGNIRNCFFFYDWMPRSHKHYPMAIG